MRGKYAAKAATKRTEQETESLIAGYQKEIRKLKAENASLAEKRRESEARHSEEIRRISAELHESVSPELKAAKRLLAEVREELGRVRATAAQRIHDSQTLANHMLGKFQQENGGKIPRSLIEVFGTDKASLKRASDALGFTQAGTSRSAKYQGAAPQTTHFETASVAVILRSLA